MSVVRLEHPRGQLLGLIAGILCAMVVFVGLMPLAIVALSHNYSITTHLDPTTITVLHEHGR
jgi:hypothetical protein